MKRYLEISEKSFLKGHVKCELMDLSGNVIETKEYKNMVVSVVKNAFAAMINGEVSSFTGIINYGAVGTSTASPALTDIQLTAEIARVVPEPPNSRSANVTTITFYFDPTVGNGLLKEFGAFIDATGTANTGILFDRVNIDVTKTSLTSLRITLTVTVS